jgi:fatty acid desaturase
MAKPYLPAPQPATRIVHYADPTAPAAGLQLMTERELAERRERDRVLYARWMVRRAEQAERDRKVRRFLFGFGAVVGLAVLAAIAGLIWAIANAAASIGLGLLAIPAVILTVGGLAVGGHKCITVVQHWH